QSDKATEFGILSFVHDAHPATAKLLNDAVVRDGLADHGIGAMLGAVQGQVNESRGVGDISEGLLA
ncbi:MAG TPA: hypothetical protein VFR42_13805, partial [Candidatus Acidoferrum sp.]|nr:hypothetical protein [Candidatus Acidoferrum sp.]